MKLKSSFQAVSKNLKTKTTFIHTAMGHPSPTGQCSTKFFCSEFLMLTSHKIFLLANSFYEVL